MVCEYSICRISRGLRCFLIFYVLASDYKVNRQLPPNLSLQKLTLGWHSSQTCWAPMPSGQRTCGAPPLPQRQSYGLPLCQDCAESAKIPNMTTCPERLMDWGLLANYYNQMHGSMRSDVFCKLDIPLVPRLWFVPKLG